MDYFPWRLVASIIVLILTGGLIGAGMYEQAVLDTARCSFGVTPRPGSPRREH